MKKKLLVAATATVLSCASATAAAQGAMSSGAKGISASVESGLFDTSPTTVWRGKYFMSPDMALLGGIGFNSYGGDADGSDLLIEGGARSYLSTGSFAPFIGGTFAYESIESGRHPAVIFGGTQAVEEVTTIALLGEFGAEYFFSPQFSVEGALRAGFSSSDIDMVTGLGTTTYTETRFGTFGSQVSVNYYF